MNRRRLTRAAGLVRAAVRRRRAVGYTAADLKQAAATLANTKDFLHVLPAREAHYMIAGRIIASVDFARTHRARTSTRKDS